jgi:hypothetical protein
MGRFQVAVIVGALFAAPASAKPPADMPIDPAVHAWFESLVRADGVHCCGSADCRIADPATLRTSAKGIEILLNGEWQAVPESLLVHREDAPFAATIVCKAKIDESDITDSLERLYCVVPYSGG